VTVWSTTSSSRGGWWTWRRRSCSSRTPAGVITTPCQPREARKPQQGGELGQGVPRTRDRGGRAPAVVSAKACALWRAWATAASPDSASLSSKMAQKAALTSAWACLGTRAGRLRQRWIRQRCRRRLERTSSTAPISPGAVGSHQQRRPQAHLEVAALAEQVLQLDPAEIAELPGVELVLDRLADAHHGRLGQRRLRPSASASAASTSRTLKPPTNPANTSDSSALVRDALPSRREATARWCRAAWAAPAPPPGRRSS
jgi:hypothetical protein